MEPFQLLSSIVYKLVYIYLESVYTSYYTLIEVNVTTIPIDNQCIGYE